MDYSKELDKQKDLIKQEIKEEESIVDPSEGIWFPTDSLVTLRNGKRYRIPPPTFRQSREIMKICNSINIDRVALNLMEEDKSNELIKLMKIAFNLYPEIDNDFIEDNIDIVIVEEILLILWTGSGVKK